MNPIAEEDVRIVLANEASWDDLTAIFGTTDKDHRIDFATEGGARRRGP